MRRIGRLVTPAAALEAGSTADGHAADSHCSSHAAAAPRLRRLPLPLTQRCLAVPQGHGIIGCFRFTESYYLLVVARREYVGHICGACRPCAVGCGCALLQPAADGGVGLLCMGSRAHTGQPHTQKQSAAQH